MRAPASPEASARRMAAGGRGSDEGYVRTAWATLHAPKRKSRATTKDRTKARAAARKAKRKAARKARRRNR